MRTRYLVLSTMYGSVVARRIVALFLLLAPLVALTITADARTRFLVNNTLLLSGTATALSIALGVPLALLISRTDLPGRRAANLVLTVLLFIPLYLQAAAWQAGFGMQGWFSLAELGPPLIDGWRGAIWIHAVAAVPWIVLIVGLGLRAVEPELEEEALLDATPCRVFRRVTLRRAGPAIGAAALWVAVITSGEMTVTNLFLVRTYAEELYTVFALGGEPGSAPLQLLPGVLAAVWLIVAGFFVTTQITTHHRHTSQRATWTFRLKSWRWPLAMFAWTEVLLLSGVPLVSLAYKAGIVITRTSEGWLRSWSLGKCVAMTVQSPLRFAHEFGWSLLIGSLAASAAVLLAIPLAWSARRGGWRAVPAFSLAAVSLALPGPLVGIGIIDLMNRPGIPLLVTLYDRSIAAPWLAQSFRAIPVATLVLWHALSSVPNELLESAASEGAGALTRLCKIVLPQRWPAVGAAWLAALSVALGDLAATILVEPPGVTTLSVRIFGLIHYGVDDQVAGISLALAAGFAVIAVASLWLIHSVSEAANE